jgi:hypothetical protein
MQANLKNEILKNENGCGKAAMDGRLWACIFSKVGILNYGDLVLLEKREQST